MVPEEVRAEAADSIAYEAYWRKIDPVRGCVGVITRLQEEIMAIKREIAEARAMIAIESARVPKWEILSYPGDEDLNKPPSSLA